MAKSSPLISICIPTFNGSNTINKTLNSIIPQLDDNFEVIISDDCSFDNTVSLIDDAQKNCKNIKLYQNDNNLGMDGNFYKTTQLATGKYIWFCGQDDILELGLLKKVFDIVSNKKNIGILNLNFSQYDHDMDKCITESFFRESAFKQDAIENSEELYFENPKDYFNTLTQPPSFLPSVVMLRKYWLNSNVQQFFGTYFIQVGVLLLNMHKNRICVFTPSMIKGRIPNDQWQQNGNRLFAIMTGDLVAKKIAFTQNKNLPQHIFFRDKLRYFLNYFFLLYQAKKIGFRCSENSKTQLKTIFGNGLIYKIYIYPLLYLHMGIMHIINMPLLLIKRLVFLLPGMKRLKL
jgi:glycosyltransferase involved in cell wall biosynthesis